MKSSIAIVDYGMGNLRSVQNSLEHLGYQGSIVSDPLKLLTYNKIILPGVGAFGQAISCLHQSGMADALGECKSSGTHILGICLGMQLMCALSEEDGIHQGLGWFSARVTKFELEAKLQIPHMGWNGVDFMRDDKLFNGLQSGDDAYFVHSYHAVCDNDCDVLATTDYGIQFTSVIQRDNLWGIQFHPEKSQGFGLAMIRNYLEIPC
jgi:glutamine amidotransferase